MSPVDVSFIRLPRPCRPSRSIPSLVAAQARAGVDPWSLADEIVRTMRDSAVSPDATSTSRSYGAVGDGKARRARMRSARRSTPVAPPAAVASSCRTGRFLTGAIHLKSNVNLHLADKATLAFSSRFATDYPIVFTRWEGRRADELLAVHLRVRDGEHRGDRPGTLDGQAGDRTTGGTGGSRAPGNARPRSGRRANRLIEMQARGVPVAERVFGERPTISARISSSPIAAATCSIEGVTIVNSPMWEIHPVLCQNVTVRDVNDPTATARTTTAAIPSRAATC